MGVCAKCGSELTPKDWGNGGIVQNDSSGRMHDTERCLTAQLAQRDAEMAALQARIAELEEQAKVRYDVLVDNANRTNEAADRINTEMANLRHEAAVLRADGEQSKTRDFQRIAERDARIAQLEAALDRDRTGLAQALAKAHQRVKSGWWITEGRGVYAWDDDQYREETRIVLQDVLTIVTMALHESGEVARAGLMPSLITRATPIASVTCTEPAADGAGKGTQ